MSFSDALLGPVAHIVVGSAESTQTFTVHSKLLCDSSHYFEAALNNGFAETAEQRIVLDDEKPEVFRSFVLWLYRSELEAEDFAFHTTRRDVAEQHLLELYIFADKRGISELANDAITMLASIWSLFGGIELDRISWALHLVPCKGKLSDMIIDIMLADLRCEQYTEVYLNSLDLRNDTLVALLMKERFYTGDFDSDGLCFESICHYHAHDGKNAITEDECELSLKQKWKVFSQDKSLPDQVPREWGP